MEIKTYPVGSVIKADETTYLVVGIKFMEQGNRWVKHYKIVPFPAGQFDEKSLRVVKAEDVELIREGYKNDMSEALLRFFNKIDKLSQENDAETIKQAFKDAEQIVKENSSWKIS